MKVHGTLSRYRDGKCRCDPCRAANAARRKVDRARAPGKNPATCKAYHLAHQEEAKARDKAYYQANAERVKARQTAYRAANPERVRAAWVSRRAQKAELFDENVYVRVLGERDGWTCQVCHEPVDKDLAWPDPMMGSHGHVVDQAAGGRWGYANAQLEHLRCNLRKPKVRAA